VIVFLVILLVGGVCIAGWRISKQRTHFVYHKLDAEMEALRRAIAASEE